MAAGTQCRRPARSAGRDRAAGTDQQRRAGAAQHAGGGKAGDGGAPWRARNRAAAIGAAISRRRAKTAQRTFMTLADADAHRRSAAPRAAPSHDARAPWNSPAHRRRLLIEPQIRAALEEDLGRAGDITRELTIPAEPGRRSPAGGAQAGPHRRPDLRPRSPFGWSIRPALRRDGAGWQPTPQPAPCSPRSRGPARAILTAERVALNFLGHLSGVATATAALVEAVEGTRARIVCTRKTLPGLRILQKYAVRCGGGFNHRFGLDDAVLIKDNHIAAAGGIAPALERVRAGPRPYGQDRDRSRHAWRSWRKRCRWAPIRSCWTI